MARILLATDGSPSAASAAAEATALARATGWPLTIVTVWRVPATGFAYEPLVAGPEVGEAVREKAERALVDAAATARGAGVEPDTELVEGVPADAICALAEERGATVIVIGSHGWGAVHRLLFGSVSAAVLHNAPCPVLVVRAVGAEAAPGF
jgi:nucleotide-binding universal stress UspA family protein